MRRRLIALGILLNGLGAVGTISGAQSVPRPDGGVPLNGALSNGVSPSVAAAVEVARVRVEQGEGEEARALLDSLARVVPARSADLAEVLYWRGALAERVTEAERDWRRAIRDVPTAPRIPDLLIRLGELEMLRQQPAEAQPHFERMVRDFHQHAQRPRALVWLVTSQMAQQNLSGACRTLTLLDAASQASDMSERMSEIDGGVDIDALRRRCPTPDTTGTSTVDTAAVSTVAAPTSVTPTSVIPAVAAETPGGSSSDSTVVTVGRFAVQVGAYETRQEAEGQVALMKRYGFEARIDGDVPWFRVRIGRFATRQEAVALFARVRATGITAFVTELSR